MLYMTAQDVEDYLTLADEATSLLDLGSWLSGGRFSFISDSSGILRASD